MQLIIQNRSLKFNDTVVKNPKFIPRMGESVVIKNNSCYIPIVTSVLCSYEEEEEIVTITVE